VMQDTTLELAAGWRPGERVSAMAAMQRIAFDVIVRAVFGVDEPDRVESFHALNDRAIGVVKPIYLFVPALRRRVVPGWRRFLEARERFDALLRDQIDRRRRASGPHEDILGLLLD